MKDEKFERWWARHHPWDWWAKERDGEPLSHSDRLLVWQLAQEAYRAGKAGEESLPTEK